MGEELINVKCERVRSSPSGVHPLSPGRASVPIYIYIYITAVDFIFSETHFRMQLDALRPSGGPASMPDESSPSGVQFVEDPATSSGQTEAAAKVAEAVQLGQGAMAAKRPANITAATPTKELDETMIVLGLLAVAVVV